MAVITRPGQCGGPRAAYGLFDGKEPAPVVEPVGLPPLVTGVWRPRVAGRLAGPVHGTYRPEAR